MKANAIESAPEDATMMRMRAAMRAYQNVFGVLPPQVRDIETPEQYMARVEAAVAAKKPLPDDKGPKQ